MRLLEKKLIDAAELLIERHGVHGFSLREAARKVKVDPAMVYRHFHDRADLVRAVADRGFMRLSRAMREGAQKAGAGAGAERLRVWGEVYLSFAISEPALYRLMFGPDRGPIAPPGEEPSPLALLQECLEELAKTRPLPLSRDDAAAVFWAGMHGVALLLLDGSLEKTLRLQKSTLPGLMLSTLIEQLGCAQAPKTRTKRRPQPK